MELALYHPEFGYYAQVPDQVGKDGDFFTSVSCGPLFGKIIAERIASWWHESNIQGPWRIIEPGPNNAALAIDILEALQLHHPDLAKELEYLTVDPMPIPRSYQSAALARFGSQVQCLADLTAIAPLPTFVIANEIIDALSCRLLQNHQAQWHEVFVKYENDAWSELLRPANEQIIPTSLRDLDAFPDGYRTEFRDQVGGFLASLLPAVSHARMLFFDYGFASPELYHPDRSKGTLRVYRKHAASENALEMPGDSDITAHVDFTDLAMQAIQLGGSITHYEPQEFFLTRHAAEKLESWADSPQLLRNFQTLTHPAQLGGKFHAIELSFGENQASSSIALRRLAIESS